MTQIEALGLVEVPGFKGYYATEEGSLYRDVDGTKEMFEAVGSYPNGETPKVTIDNRRYNIGHLIALAFISNTDPERTVVFHLDENPSNNKVDNLIWISRSELRTITARNNLPKKNLAFIEKLRNFGK